MDNLDMDRSQEREENEGQPSRRSYGKSASSDGRLRLVNELTRIQLMTQRQSQKDQSDKRDDA